MMNWQALKELAQNTAGTDAEVAATLATPSVAKRQLVPLWKIAELARKEGWWYAVKASAEPAAVAFMEYYQDARFENIDMDLEAAKNALAGLVATGLITQPQADAVDALANTLQTPLAAAGLPLVHAGDIAHARSL